MRADRHPCDLPRAHKWIWIIAIWSIAGCSARQTHEYSTALTPSLVETWIIQTRACDQKLGPDPLPSMTIARLDAIDEPLRGSDPDTLLGRMAGRTSVIVIHGYGFTYRNAVKEAVEVRTLLEATGGLSPESLLIVFDWPSERELTDLYADLSDKARRAEVASYHLARFLQDSPPGARICLMGQSDGGRIALTTLHFLAGAVLPPFWFEPAAQLSSGRPDLRLRGVIVDAAAGHHWLNPGERLDHALSASESLLNLRNSRDYALALYIFGTYTGLRGAIGRVGLNSHDLEKLGPLSDRVEQMDLHPMVGISHTSFAQALSIPEVAEKVARYTTFPNEYTKSANLIQ